MITFLLILIVLILLIGADNFLAITLWLIKWAIILGVFAASGLSIYFVVMQ